VQDADLFAFLAIFRQLLRVFPKRIEESEVEDLSKAYFGTLRRFTIAELQSGADAWMQRGKFFPKPAEWREAIPRRHVETEALAPLTPVEAAEYLDAERRSYEGDPCSCRRCLSAGVEHRPLRYVPEVDGADRDLRGLIGERSVVRGRWIHGEDLRRWYDARDVFMALKTKWLSTHGIKRGARKDFEISPYEPVMAARQPGGDQ
jgi:hypothetical protein